MHHHALSVKDNREHLHAMDPLFAHLFMTNTFCGWCDFFIFDEHQLLNSHWSYERARLSYILNITMYNIVISNDLGGVSKTLMSS